MAILICNSEARRAINQGVKFFLEGATLLDTLEYTLKLVEDDEEVRTVGRGGFPNVLGRMQLDASIMDGSSRRSGSVGALSGFRHPIAIARAVMERLPHEILVGAGAERFATECGFLQDANLTAEATERWKTWAEANAGQEFFHKLDSTPLIPLVNKSSFDLFQTKDTAVILGQEKSGQLASATSTSGWPYKYPGRLGDSPIVGAGHYADTRYGAAACTGTGELTIRAGTARSVVLYLKMGLPVQEAVSQAAEDIKSLSGGAQGNVNIYAIDTKGNYFAVSTLSSRGFYVWKDGMPEAQVEETVALL